MKKIFYFAAICSILFTACKKDDDEGKLPNIAFKTGAGYTSSDITTNQSDTLTIGITASKAEDKDVLTTFDAARSYDVGTSTSFLNLSLSGSDGDSYSKDVTVITRAQAGTEKYIFTVINRDGLKNSVSLTVTVN